MKMIDIPETRGRPSKYDFSLSIGERREYANTTSNLLLAAAKGWTRRRKLKWKFKCRTIDGQIHLWRVE